MKYFFLERYKPFWEDLMAMLDENYCYDLDIDTTVIIGACAQYSIDELRNNGAPLRKRIIVYQLEPLVETHWFSPKSIIQNLKDADEVWDYDLDNIKVLEEYGIKAKYRPLLYTNHLKRIKNVENPDIDVLFYGTILPRRMSLLYESIYKTNYPAEHTNTLLNSSFVCLNHVWGENLDHFISRSKIVLNLNTHDGDNRQQQTRIFYALTNNKCVVSEKANRNYFGDLINEFSSAQELILLLGDLLHDDKWKTYTKTNFSGYSNTVRNLIIDK